MRNPVQKRSRITANGRPPGANPVNVQPVCGKPTDGKPVFVKLPGRKLISEKPLAEKLISGKFIAGKFVFGKLQLYCLLGSALLAAAAALSADGTTVVENGRIRRGAPGSEGADYTLTVQSLHSNVPGGVAVSADADADVNADIPLRDHAGSTAYADAAAEAHVPVPVRSVTVHVSGRSYREDEANALFEQLMEVLPAYILGENASLSHVSSPLLFPGSLPAFPGISLQFRPEKADLIATDGRLLTEGLSEPTDTFLSVTLKTGGFEQTYVLPLTLYPVEFTLDEQFSGALNAVLSEADSATSTDDYFYLPGQVLGNPVAFHEPRSSAPLLILVLGTVSALLTACLPEQNRKQEIKRRNSALELAYAELVSGFLVYIGAGLSVRSTWAILCGSQGCVDNKSPPSGYLENEMKITLNELENGFPETRAYMNFANRTGLRCYMKFCSLISRYLQNGDQGLNTALEYEMAEAFRQRKNLALQRGEEAGTKLLAPLILSLITVMVIVTAPALMRL